MVKVRRLLLAHIAHVAFARLELLHSVAILQSLLDVNVYISCPRMIKGTSACGRKMMQRNTVLISCKVSELSL